METLGRRVPYRCRFGAAGYVLKLAGRKAQIRQFGGGHGPNALRRGQQAFWVSVTLGVCLGFGPGERVMMP
jgi:hypothetical protein